MTSMGSWPPVPSPLKTEHPLLTGLVQAQLTAPEINARHGPARRQQRRQTGARAEALTADTDRAALAAQGNQSLGAATTADQARELQIRLGGLVWGACRRSSDRCEGVKSPLGLCRHHLLWCRHRNETRRRTRSRKLRRSSLGEITSKL